MTSFLIKDVRIFDGTETIVNGSVLVKNGKISKGVFLTYPKLQEQIEGGDCADLKYTSFAATVEMGWPMPVVLAFHNTPEVRMELAAWPKLTTPESGRRYVQDRLAESVDYIKLMHESGTFWGQNFNMQSVELQKAVTDEAHKHGLKVVAHSLSLDDTIEKLECGVDGLIHTFVDQPPNQKLLDLYKKTGAHCNATLATVGSITAEGQEMQEKFAHDPRVQHLMGEGEKGQMCGCMSFAKWRGGMSIAHGYETVRQLKKAGVPVIVGSDAARPALGTAYGLSMHHELSLFVNECGFTPAEALHAATALVAERFSFEDRGQIKEGLIADLVLVEGNPLENIDHTLDLRAVWKGGEICSTYEEKL